jgi:hypothetical protein
VYHYHYRPHTLGELKTTLTAYIRNISQADLQKVFTDKMKWVLALYRCSWTPFPTGSCLPTPFISAQRLSERTVLLVLFLFLPYYYLYLWELFFFNLILEVSALLLYSTSSPLLVTVTKTEYCIDDYHLLHLQCSSHFLSPNSTHDIGCAMLINFSK